MKRPPVTACLTFSGRTFSIQELRLVQEVSSDCTALSLTEISRTLCELLDWRRANGQLKNHECRQLLERLAERNLLLRLPALRRCGPLGPRRVYLTERSDPEPELVGWVGQFQPLRLERVGRDGAQSRLWAELVERHHYLGYRVPVGAHLRYLVYSAQDPQRVLACLLWTSPAWKMAVRDRWIGWTEAQRRGNLQRIVNNARFLILPWVRIGGLASKILSLATRQLPHDWEQHYGYCPLLLETLVDPSRFRGTCYRAANWIYLGQSQGRGRMDRDNVAQGRAVKDIYVYPLGRHARQRLCQEPTPAFSTPMPEIHP